MNKLAKRAILMASLSILSSCNQTTVFKPEFRPYGSTITAKEYQNAYSLLATEYYAKYLQSNTVYSLVKNAEIDLKYAIHYENENENNDNNAIATSHNQIEATLRYDVINSRFTIKSIQKRYSNESYANYGIYSNDKYAFIKEEYIHYNRATNVITDLLIGTSTTLSNQIELYSLYVYDSCLGQVLNIDSYSYSSTKEYFKSGTTLTVNRFYNNNDLTDSAIYQFSFGEQINLKCYSESEKKDQYKSTTSIEMIIKPLEGEVEQIDYTKYN